MMKHNDNPDQPEWLEGKRINELKFCEEFLRLHPMKYIRGQF